MLKIITRACSPEKSWGFSKPRPMAWASITTHLRCSRLTAKEQSHQSSQVQRKTGSPLCRPHLADNPLTVQLLHAHISPDSDTPRMWKLTQASTYQKCSKVLLSSAV